MMECLDVYLCGQRVGILERIEGRLSFRYLSEYLSTGREAISVTLPLSEKSYEERDVMAFFSNLLPDEGVRRRIADILQLSVDDTFGLLRKIGGDCAGAIAFWEPGRRPEDIAEGRYRELSDMEGYALLEDLANRPLGMDESFRGISGAGAQDKLIACLKEGHILLPLDGTPSTHIIKPGIERFPGSVFNEYFCMQLSKRCGFRTAESSILELRGVSYYATRRYDRELVGGVVRRLHQEDFCQLARCRPEIKYQDQGGPSIVDCMRLIRAELRLPAVDVIDFVDRTVFNFLVGNGDAHGKNFSVLYVGGRPRLSPVYDVICTAVYPTIAKKMAMKFDGKFEFRWITPGKIIRTFERAGLNGKVVIDSIKRVSSSVKDQLPSLSDEVNARYPADVYHDIIRGTYARLRQLETD